MPNIFGTNCGFGFCRRFIREDMMRTLFEMDKKNYDSSGKVFTVRPFGALSFAAAGLQWFTA